MTGVAPILVFAFGNPSRGDDAIGPLLAERLSAWLCASAIPDVEVLVDFQLQLEHALDLAERKRVLFVDADAGSAFPYRIERVVPRPVAAHTSHAFSPEALLDVARRVLESPLPEAEVLAVRGERFELGEPLSDRAKEGADRAFEFLVGWCQRAGGSDA